MMSPIWRQCKLSQPSLWCSSASQEPSAPLERGRASLAMTCICCRQSIHQCLTAQRQVCRHSVTADTWACLYLGTTAAGVMQLHVSGDIAGMQRIHLGLTTEVCKHSVTADTWACLSLNTTAAGVMQVDVSIVAVSLAYSAYTAVLAEAIVQLLQCGYSGLLVPLWTAMQHGSCSYMSMAKLSTYSTVSVCRAG